MDGRRAGEGSGGKRQVVRRGREGKSDAAAAPALVLVNGKSTGRVSSESSFAELKILRNHYLINLKIAPRHLLTLHSSDYL